MLPSPLAPTLRLQSTPAPFHGCHSCQGLWHWMSHLDDSRAGWGQKVSQDSGLFPGSSSTQCRFWMKCTQVSWHGLLSVHITQTAIARNPRILLGTEDSQFLGSFPWKALDV